MNNLHIEFISSYFNSLIQILRMFMHKFMHLRLTKRKNGEKKKLDLFKCFSFWINKFLVLSKTTLEH